MCIVVPNRNTWLTFNQKIAQVFSVQVAVCCNANIKQSGRFVAFTAAFISGPHGISPTDWMSSIVNGIVGFSAQRDVGLGRWRLVYEDDV